MNNQPESVNSLHDFINNFVSLIKENQSINIYEMLNLILDFFKSFDQHISALLFIVIVVALCFPFLRSSIISPVLFLLIIFFIVMYITKETIHFAIDLHMVF